MEKVYHTLKPYYNKDSKVLILGSIPSVKSREYNFYYMHSQNRFYKVLAKVFNAKEPLTIEDKKAFLKINKIALYDVIKSCEIKGSSDETITNVEVNDLSIIIDKANIQKIFTTGKKAYDLYKKYLLPKIKKEAIYLPSTSLANCAFSIDDLVREYKIIKEFINDN